MRSLFKSTSNTRAILPDSYRYIRSDVLTAFAATHPEVNAEIIIPKGAYMRDFLAWYRRHRDIIESQTTGE